MLQLLPSLEARPSAAGHCGALERSDAMVVQESFGSPRRTCSDSVYPVLGRSDVDDPRMATWVLDQFVGASDVDETPLMQRCTGDDDDRSRGSSNRWSPDHLCRSRHSGCTNLANRQGRVVPAMPAVGLRIVGLMPNRGSCGRPSRLCMTRPKQAPSTRSGCVPAGSPQGGGVSQGVKRRPTPSGREANRKQFLLQRRPRASE